MERRGSKEGWEEEKLVRKVRRERGVFCGMGTLAEKLPW